MCLWKKQKQINQKVMADEALQSCSSDFRLMLSRIVIYKRNKRTHYTTSDIFKKINLSGGGTVVSKLNNLQLSHLSKK